MTIATVFAYLATRWFGLPEGYWAVITCLVVVQGSLGATLSAGIARLHATIAGALLGAAGAWLHARFGLPSVYVLILVIAPLALLAAGNAKYRIAPVTAALVLLAIHAGTGSFTVALHRIAEIVVGGVIGALTALLVLPDRGAAGVRAQGAAALATLGQIVRHYLAESGDIDALNARLQKHISGMQAADAEAAQERQFHLSDEPTAGPLMRTMRRLRTDVGMVGRTVSEQPGTQEEHAALAAAVSAWFNAASQALATCAPAPDLTAVDRAGTGLRPDTTLQLAFQVLRRDMGDAADRITERSQGISPRHRRATLAQRLRLWPAGVRGRR